MENYVRKEEVVPCDGCYCLLFRKDAKEVSWFGDTNYYCNNCKPPYDGAMDGNFYRNHVAVDKNGEPIGYKKINKKNAKITHTTGEK